MIQATKTTAQPPEGSVLIPGALFGGMYALNPETDQLYKFYRKRWRESAWKVCKNGGMRGIQMSGFWVRRSKVYERIN